jgi:hypothetical protein
LGLIVPFLFPVGEPLRRHSSFGHSFRFLAWRTVTRVTGSSIFTLLVTAFTRLEEVNSEWFPSAQVEMAAGRNRVQRVARLRYEDFAFADHFKLIALDHNDCIRVDADAE